MDSAEKSRVISSQLFRWALIAFFLLPFFFLIRLFTQSEAIDWAEFYWAFINTFRQSFLSGVFAVGVGAFFALGLRWIAEVRGRRIYLCLKALLLLPALLPSLFVLLVGFELISPFPRGEIGIALMHTMASAGLCAVIIESIFAEKLANLSESAWVLGASRLLFWKNSFRLVWVDFSSVFFFIFIFSFSSFAIPLIIGGSRGTTIEVLIYEKIRISSSWGQAIVLSIVQSLLLAGFSFLPTRTTTANKLRTGSPLLRSKFGAGTALVFALSFALVLFSAGFKGWSQVLQIEGLWRQALALLPVTACIAFVSWFVFYFLMKALTYFWYDVRIAKFLAGYIAPSVALVGLVGVSISGWTAVPGFGHWLIYLGGMVILFLPTLFRMNWQGRVGALAIQISTAQTLGADESQIFRRILWPQLRGGAFGIAVMGALWVMGDFALAKILFSQPVTLALLIESLLTSYRLDAALALTQVWILVAVTVTFLLWGGHRVRR